MDGLKKPVPGHPGYEVEHNLIYGHRLLLHGKPATTFWYNSTDAAKIMLEWKQPRHVKRCPSFVDVIIIAIITVGCYHFVLRYAAWW
jgi:hypothetical protein